MKSIRSTRRLTGLAILGAITPSLGACAAPQGDEQPSGRSGVESSSAFADQHPQAPSGGQQVAPVNRPEQPESDRAAGLLQTVRQAADPSSTIEAYARAREAYESGGISTVELLLSSDSFSQFSDRVEYLSVS